MPEHVDPIRLLIHGANGRMGQALLRLCADAGADGACQVVAAVSRRAPAQRVVAGVARLAAGEMSGAPPFDVLVDFSLPEGFDAALALALARNTAFVSGTTGLSDAQRAALEAAAAQIPVLWASNFSIGVAVLHALARQAAQLLPDWDCDIVEMHHARKQDAPSGTALTLADAVARGERRPQVAAIRAGDIVGEHCVQFAGPGERLELVHRAGDRDIFARGALQAAAWLARQPPGHYAIADLLGTAMALDSPGRSR